MTKLERKLSKGRPKGTHGGFAFLTTGRLPAHRVSLQRYLSACRNGLIEDLGGEVNMSTQELILIDRCTSLLGVLRCIEEDAKEKGIFDGNGLRSSLGKHYLGFTNSLKQILALLGLKKQDLDGLSPLEFIEQFDKQKAQQESSVTGEKDLTKTLNQSEKGAHRASESDILQGK